MSGQKLLLINTAGVEKVYNLFHLFHACSAIYIYTGILILLAGQPGDYQLKESILEEGGAIVAKIRASAILLKITC